MKIIRGLSYKECIAENCKEEKKAKGYCEKHYRRLLKRGTASDEGIRKTDTGDEIERFHKKYVVNEFDCWVWTGSLLENKNYPRHSLNNGKYMGARRFSYTLKHGKLDKKIHISTKCGNDLCVNPDHFILKETK